MPKIKYRFNKESLKYEKVERTIGQTLLRVFGFMSAAAVFAFIILYTSYGFFSSPREKRLKQEIAIYKNLIVDLSNDVDQVSAIAIDLEERDEGIYREIFGAPLPKSLRISGVGGVDRYQNFNGLTHASSLKDLKSRIDHLKRKMYVQSKSYDELVVLVSEKEKMLSAIPAIQPVANQDLKRMVSGYGYRIDPFYKTRKMHWGMDFSAPKGTNVYATGDGVVVKVMTKRWGYGKHIIIRHGFGYTTKYGHLSSFKVRKGQHVKRGQIIGLVGSTGKSTAPHLHYEVEKGGTKVNPSNYYFNDLSPEEYEKVLELSSTSNQSFD
jgi:murein DD-endopeptidase MepM/ murein hydrolase activator NlpD